MRTMNFDAIATAAPLNRDASIARDGSGDQWDVSIPAHQLRWLAPPQLKTVHSAPGKVMLKQMVGRRVGRLTVLGVWEGGNQKKGATWVCRCDCGYYEGRKAKALTGPDADKLACFACSKLIRLQQRGSQNTAASRKAEAVRLDELAKRA